MKTAVKKPTKKVTAKKSMSQSEIIESINEKVIAGLQEKGLKWLKPFKDGVTGSYSAISAYGTAYRGGWNQWILSNTAKDNGWVNKWFTWDNVIKAGFRVLESEAKKPTIIYLYMVSWVVNKENEAPVYYHKVTEIPEADKDIAKKIGSYRLYALYSISQTTIPFDAPSLPVEAEDLEYIDEAEVILQAWSKEVKLTHSTQDRAFYSPSGDYIQMPKKKADQWKSSGDYYKVFFHEAIHSTGHTSRLDRLSKTNNRFGSDEYSREELVAEMGALYLEAITNIHCVVDDYKNSQAYINGWIKAFKSDEKLILDASYQSTKAIELILSKVA
jgi:antirestriction protein ArdC